MKHKANYPRTMMMIAISMVLAACGAPQPTDTPIPPSASFTPAPPTSTDTPVLPTTTATNTFAPPQPLCDDVEGPCLEIRFDDDGCRHVGPEVLPAGEITLVFSNYTGRDVGIDLEVLDEGKTVQNMRSYMGPSPSNAFQPSWSQDVVQAGVSAGGNTTRHPELASGTYISVCWQMNPHLVWFGGGLIVE